MPDLYLWMQAQSDEGETKLVSVESTDKFDNSTVDCSDEDFRSIEARPSTAQNDSKRTAENSLTNKKRAEGIRSAAHDFQGDTIRGTCLIQIQHMRH